MKTLSEQGHSIIMGVTRLLTTFPKAILLHSSLLGAIETYETHCKLAWW